MRKELMFYVTIFAFTTLLTDGISFISLLVMTSILVIPQIVLPMSIGPRFYVIRTVAMRELCEHLTEIRAGKRITLWPMGLPDV